MKAAGDICSCCRDERAERILKPRRLVLVNGALVCRHCDVVSEWPNQQQGKAA